jgi:hypothetical protein
MLVLSTFILSLIPAIILILPLVKKHATNVFIPQDESSLLADLERRWESSIEGLMGIELEYGIGNLRREDYDFLKETYYYEAALVLKALKLSKNEEEQLMAQIQQNLVIKNPPNGPRSL